MLRIKSPIYLTGRANSNDQILKSKQCVLPWKVLVIEYWNLRFIYVLVLGFCIFRHKTPKQGHLALTWRQGPGFLWKNK
jgi:hypothetical protein